MKYLMFFLIAFNSHALAGEFNIDFKSNISVESKKWLIVNDSVMGGRSFSQIEFQDESAIFFGVVSLENYGGFASVRRKLIENETLLANSLKLLIKGDGRKYKIRFRLNGYLDGPAYEATIQTNADEKIEILLNQNEFEPVYRSRILKGFAPFDFSKALQFEIMLADKVSGDFQLEIFEIQFLNE